MYQSQIDARAEIKHGDCLAVMPTVAENSVDSIVTDPPYGISFMGKKWDYNVPSVDVWREALRVLKPGGHALIACGTRTQHRMAVNIEDAGFEIRDIVGWIYGSGFPKSLNIGKAVDKLQGNERESIGEQRLTGNAGTPTKLKGGTYTAGVCINMTGVKIPLTKGNSPHEGYGTALKPAMELWTLCRKPLSEPTVAANVLKWGTGGINVDGCRVGTGDMLGRKNNVNPYGSNRTWSVSKTPPQDNTENPPQGRFPANLIHDGSDEVVGLFPQSVGQQGDVKGTEPSHTGQNGIYGEFNRTVSNPKRNDSGSAARFFYCAKASKAERNAGLEGFEEKQTWASQEKRESNSFDVFESDGRSKTINKNHHPTVKPIALMRYLCRLITPPKGVVLDPFMGSGSTGIAAKLEGFGFVGIERDAEYCRIAEARIEHELRQPRLNI